MSDEADDISMDDAIAALKAWLMNSVPQIIYQPELVPALWAIVQHHERGGR